MTAQFNQDLHRLAELSPEEIVTLLEQSDAFRRAERFKQLLWVAETVAATPAQQEAKNWLMMLEICGKISAQTLIKQGFQGEEIKKGLHQQRVDAIALSNNK